MHEPPVLRTQQRRIKTRNRVLKKQRRVPDQSRIHRADNFEEAPHGFEADLVPACGPVGAVAFGGAGEEEVVGGVEVGARFGVDLAVGAEEGGREGKVVGGVEVEAFGGGENAFVAV